MRKLKIRKPLNLIILFFICLHLVSCEHESASPVDQPNMEKAEKVKPPVRTFAIIYPMTDPFFESITKNALETAKLLNVNIIVKAPDEAYLEQQIRMMETLIKQQINGIAIDPVDAEALTPYINKAVKAGIKVVCFDSDAPQSQRLSYIGTDNLTAGRHMGKVIAKLLDGRGMVIVGSGLESMLNLNQRLFGLVEYLKRYTDIQLLEVLSNKGDASKALTNLEEMIDAHPHFDAFIGMDSLSGPAAILVWKAMGLSKKAITFDAMPDILEGIRNGQITTAISQREYLWGKLIVTRLNEACDGKEIPLFDNTGTEEISLNNVNSYESIVTN
ncbi:MAG TPA: substrate-binding domain-containing protein [Bacilli bacterium]